MPREVMEAMIEANDYFVDMYELTEAAGKRVAEVVGAEAALVTSGAFSAMILGAAACLTGTDPEKIDALPHPTWPKRDCLIQTAHRFEYDRAYRAAGMSIVEAGTREEFIDKINDRTAMIAILTAVEKQSEFGPPLPRELAHPHGPEIMMPEEFIAIGKRADVPVLIDMASDLPPAANLTRFIEAGADLVVISGGNGIRGPQSTGILAGRRDLIEAARLHAAPNGNLGRGFDARISTEFDRLLDQSACVYCGNCIGVCPTGALMFKSEHDMRNAGTWDERQQSVTRTICPYCGVGCNLELHVQDNQIVKVTSPQDHSVTNGHLCIKGRFGWQYVQNRDEEESLTGSSPAPPENDQESTGLPPRPASD